MKQLGLAALSVLMTYIASQAQPSSEKTTKEINAPNFLVHQQLTPEFIKVEYVAGLSHGVLKNGGQELSRFKVNSLTVSGYPLTLISKPQQQLYMGFGYVQDKYTFEDTNDALPILEQTFQSVNLNIFLNTRIKGKYYWFSYVQGGLQGSHPFDEVKKSHSEIWLNKINYKASRNMNVGVGVAYVSNLGKPMIVPAVAFVYSRPHYLVNIDFPVKVEVEGILARGKWRPVVGVSFPSNAYYVKSVNQYFNASGLTGYVGTSYRLLDFLYVHAKWQTGLGETFKLGSRSDRDKIGTVEGQSRFLFSINVQVARLISE